MFERHLKHLSLLFIIGLFAFGCSNGTDEKPLVVLDLLEHGLPIRIMAPDSAKVRSKDLLMMKDVTVKDAESNYAIQIWSSDRTTGQLKRLVNEQIEIIKNHPFFNEIVEEREDGFIYKTQIDSSATNYGFKYIHLQGDKEYIFQTGILGTFELDEVKAMYDAVYQKKE